MINSPVCTGRILLFPSRVLVTDLGTAGRERRAPAEKVLGMLMCPFVTPRPPHGSSCFLKAGAQGVLVIQRSKTQTAKPQRPQFESGLKDFIFVSRLLSLSVCFLSLSAAACPIKAQRQNTQQTLDKRSKLATAVGCTFDDGSDVKFKDGIGKAEKKQ